MQWCEIPSSAHEAVRKHWRGKFRLRFIAVVSRNQIHQPAAIECSHTSEPAAALPRQNLRLSFFHGDFEMRILSMIAVAGAMIASSAGAFAGELPSYDVKSFPISATQVQVLGGAGVEEQSATPAMIIAGMPASPAQISVLSPRIKRLASANSENQAR
jgi:hypothetical protein